MGKTVGERLREVRSGYDMSLRAYGRMVGFGASDILRWEAERCAPDLRSLLAVADALGMSLAALLDGVDSV